MATRKTRSRDTRRTQTTNGSGGNPRFDKIGKATSQIVQDAAALLDEELASGIVAARKVQQRFQDERKLDPSDLNEALQRFRGDAHQLVDMLNRQISAMSSKENTELATRLVSNSHDLLDLVVGLVNIGVELTNQIVQTNLPKTGRNEGKGQKR